MKINKKTTTALTILCAVFIAGTVSVLAYSVSGAAAKTDSTKRISSQQVYKTQNALKLDVRNGNMSYIIDFTAETPVRTEHKMTAGPDTAKGPVTYRSEDGHFVTFDAEYSDSDKAEIPGRIINGDKPDLELDGLQGYVTEDRNGNTRVIFYTYIEDGMDVRWTELTVTTDMKINIGSVKSNQYTNQERTAE